jgi:hypothetical protein
MNEILQSIETLKKALLSDDNIGFCLACGAEAYGVEPDARNYKCEACQERQVFGAEELIIMGKVKE